MKVGGTRLSRFSLAYVVLEDVLILGAFLGTLAFLHFGALSLGNPGVPLAAVGLLVLVKGIFFLCGLYDFRHLINRRTFWSRMGGAFVVLVACGVGAVFLLRTGVVGPAAFLTILLPLIVLARLAYEAITRHRRYRRRLLILGTGKSAQRAAREVLDFDHRDYDVVGFLCEDEEGLGWRIGRRKVLGTLQQLEEEAERHGIEKVVVAVKDRRRGLPLDGLLRLRLRGVEIVEEAKLHEEIAGKIPVEDLRPSWLIFSEGFANSALRHSTKRAFDVFFALLGLILSAPLALLTALAIRLESKGPVIFRQLRVGQGGHEFTLYKFRSMRVDAEAEGKPQWAKERDPRVTRIGRFLRRTRIDEIPQLWNVLQGTMSFVGPRPERLFFVEQLRQKIPYYDQRHVMKPGITGWAQVRFRYGADLNDAVEKLRHDMYYIKHHSILFDLRILLETVRVVFERDKGR